MYKKNHILGGVTALLLVAALAGCGGVQAPGGAGTNVKAPQVAVKDQETQAPAVTPGAKPPATQAPGTPVNPGTNPSTPAPAPPSTGAMSVTTLQKGAYSGVADRKVVLITDEAAWRTNWQQLSARMVPVPEAPALDFGGQSVLVAYMGEKNTGGYNVEITGAQMVDGKLRVTVKETRPGPGQIVTQALTQPYHMVRIPRVAAGTAVEVVWQ